VNCQVLDKRNEGFVTRVGHLKWGKTKTGVVCTDFVLPMKVSSNVICPFLWMFELHLD